MADLLTSIREQLAARLEAGREAVEECERLRAALRLLDARACDGRPARPPGRAAHPRASRTARSEKPDPVDYSEAPWQQHRRWMLTGPWNNRRAACGAGGRGGPKHNKARHSCGCVSPLVRRRAVPRGAGAWLTGWDGA